MRNHDGRASLGIGHSPTHMNFTRSILNETGEQRQASRGSYGRVAEG
jgi:hypothetical protein